MTHADDCPDPVACIVADCGANTNRLEGIRCPKCGSHEPFYITCQVVLTVFDDNNAHTSEADWNDESDIICGELTCQHYGVVADFRSEKKGGQ